MSITTFNKLHILENQKPGQIKIENRNNESTRDGKKNDNKVNDEQEEQQLFNEIGFYLENLIAKIPEGIIIVLPNMTILKNIKKAWFEPTKKYKYAEVIQQYKEEIESNKNGILIDASNNNFLDSFQFKNNLCRALFIIGKPCIFNNKNDYGCVYLIDKVNNEKTQIQQQFSKWIKKKTDFSNNLDDLVQETEQFFQQKFQPSVCIEIDQQIQQEQIQENELIQNDQFDGNEDVDFI
ncbi:hypothetical protein PPERSA_09784 [Pseudocohnilembus persalinus]|uniref:Uncharacterized protein n=1 Tax=Pseudocohnilembus persalinus TaxID=266149 RepID=A0A0V0QTI6_PSEPJ|nr:hypothetical protein PPERSA_09784 [Pseudocohnilembus persalinus]|eukprot:KRX05644.1 hypothetical protein PPERSA_09784 [Pseudocohnilembus persalinus]